MFNSMREWFKAWRRGDKRVAEKGATGRVYVKMVDEDGNNVAAHTRLKGSISARRYIKAEDRWEDLGVIAESKDE